MNPFLLKHVGGKIIDAARYVSLTITSSKARI